VLFRSSEAARWWRKAAEKGLLEAQVELGYCYENGAGVPLNKEEAIRLYRIAAQQGYGPAKDELERIEGYPAEHRVNELGNHRKRRCQP